MSLAACEERCARLRTSEATTAKPRPCSPARAASTAALSASRLVWNAISSMRRSEEHTSELQSRPHLVCRLLLEKKKQKNRNNFKRTHRRRQDTRIPTHTR